MSVETALLGTSDAATQVVLDLEELGQQQFPEDMLERLREVPGACVLDSTTTTVSQDARIAYMDTRNAS